MKKGTKKSSKKVEAVSENNVQNMQSENNVQSAEVVVETAAVTDGEVKEDVQSEEPQVVEVKTVVEVEADKLLELHVKEADYMSALLTSTMTTLEDNAYNVKAAVADGEDSPKDVREFVLSHGLRFTAVGKNTAVVTGSLENLAALKLHLPMVNKRMNLRKL